MPAIEHQIGATRRKSNASKSICVEVRQITVQNLFHLREPVERISIFLDIK